MLGKKPSKKDEKPGSKYLNTVYGLSKSVRAWRLLSFIFAILVGSMLYFYFDALNRMPVRLIPYNYAINKRVNTIQESGGIPADYLARTAIGDVSLFNNWTPRTIKTQYQRFLNRTSPSLFASEQVSLINKAEKMTDGIRTRAFFPRETNVIEGREVEVIGRLKRYEGQELVDDNQVLFRVRYRQLQGVPYIYSIDQETL